MAEPTPPTPTSPAASTGSREPGAPFPPGEIDPELIKLARPRLRIGLITAAGLVFLCVALVMRLGPDRRFAGASHTPTATTATDVLADHVALDQLVRITAEPVVSHAIRITKTRGTLGMRLVPVRGTADRLWIVAGGDGWDPPAGDGYVGRLRKLDDLALAPAARAHAEQHPRPVFATPAAVRGGFASGAVATVAGDRATLRDSDRVALDRIDPNTAVITAAFNDRLPDASAWRAALDRAGVTAVAAGVTDAAIGQVRFTVAASAAATTTRLETAELWAARVEPVTRHHETTWGALRRSPPSGLDLGGGQIAPDDQLDLVGLFVTRGIPAEAYALVTGESPDDYWYVLPITVALAVIALVFAWALIRAVRRDLVPAVRTDEA